MWHNAVRDSRSPFVILKFVVFKNKYRTAMITVELALSIAVILLVMFVVLGKFNDNIAGVAVSSKFNNIFNGNAGKTYFPHYDRDYTSSVVEIK